MPSLKEVRTRITSVKSTQQITSAMKMVAASKLRRAQNAILSLRPYASKLREMMENLSSGAGETAMASLATQRQEDRILLVLIASNRGLCGAFNANVIKAASQLIHQTYAHQYAGGKLQLMIIGKKAADYFQRRKYPILSTHHEIFDNLSYNNVIPLAEKLQDDFLSKRFDKIVLIYNQFKNAAVQRLVVESYLPLLPAASGIEPLSNTDYLYEPSRDEILNDLIPRSLRIQLYKAVLDSLASEHGARMTAMHQATDNARELLKELKLTYNKARQAAITNEILEIVSGAEALKG